MSKISQKGMIAYEGIKKFFPEGNFSAASLSEKMQTKVAANTLSALANNGYLFKHETKPITYTFNPNIEELEAQGATNDNLLVAKKVKNDEFYTRFEDIEVEAIPYKSYFKDKIVFLNCNDGPESNFYQFIIRKFNNFKIKTMYAMSYGECPMLYTLNATEDGHPVREQDVIITPLEGDGSFMSEESLTILKKCDIVFTNPPFSLFKEFIEPIIKYNKNFLVIGNENVASYQYGFALMKEGKMWRGLHGVHHFYVPNGYTSNNTTTKEGITQANFGNICWYTNLPNERHNTPLQLTASYYNPLYKREDYSFLDNQPIINVDKTINIPKDYEDLMAVPISFFNYFNPDQFELIGLMATTKKSEYNLGYPYINGKKKYARVVIKHKHPEK